jgi:hypothetical protein
VGASSWFSRLASRNVAASASDGCELWRPNIDPSCHHQEVCGAATHHCLVNQPLNQG